MSERFDFSKRKIRGWKRKIKEIETWKNYYIQLDLAALEKNHREYVKTWIHPFYSLRRYSIPFWYKRLIIEALLEIYDSWQQTMETYKTPYYLKVWLFEKDFIRSQIVVSFKEMYHSYDETFEELKNRQTLPETLFVEKAAGFSWEEGIRADVWYESELLEDVASGLYSEAEVESIKQSAYRIEQRKDDRLYLVNGDTVWVGTKKWKKK
ncbi:hypothetical protein ACYSNR_06980 [Enterococcus sp. LJL128]